MRTRFSILLPLFLFLIFLTANASTVEQIQQAIDQNGGGWSAVKTPFTDLSLTEKSRLAGLIPPSEKELKQGRWFQAKGAKDELPTIWDWRNKDGQNYMTPVKDQGYCGSCWAFATTGAVEGVIAIKEQRPGLDVDLSEQHLLSCCIGGNCELGGLTNIAMNYVADPGLPDDTCWEYVEWEAPCGETCDDWESRVIKIDGWSWVANDVTQIKLALLDGPVVTSMMLYEDFYSYDEGVYRHVWGSYAGMHAIVIVGWDDALQCWIAKNSWGEYFGESGYFRIGYMNSGFGTFTIHVDYTPTGQYTDDDDDFADDDTGEDDDDDADAGDDDTSDVGDDDDESNESDSGDDDDDGMCG